MHFIAFNMNCFTFLKNIFSNIVKFLQLIEDMELHLQKMNTKITFTTTYKMKFGKIIIDYED